MQAAKRIGTKGQHLALKVLLLQSCAGVVASGIVAILMSLDRDYLFPDGFYKMIAKRLFQLPCWRFGMLMMLAVIVLI